VNWISSVQKSKFWVNHILFYSSTLEAVTTYNVFACFHVCITSNHYNVYIVAWLLIGSKADIEVFSYIISGHTFERRAVIHLKFSSKQAFKVFLLFFDRDCVMMRLTRIKGCFYHQSQSSMSKICVHGSIMSLLISQKCYGALRYLLSFLHVPLFVHTQ